MKTTYSGRRGFTLIELLVVLAVIGIMMAILLPAVLGALASGKVTHCQNNLSQIGKAIPQYASENQDSLPYMTSGTNTWVTSLLAYLGQTTNTFWCVGDPYPSPTGDRISYGANGVVGDCPFRRQGAGAGGRPAKLRDFEGTVQMGDMILIADLHSTDLATKPTFSTIPAPAIRPGRIPNMHRKGMSANYLMASYAVRNYNTRDGAVTKVSGQGNQWTFVAPPP